MREQGTGATGLRVGGRRPLFVAGVLLAFIVLASVACLLCWRSRPARRKVDVVLVDCHESAMEALSQRIALAEADMEAQGIERTRQVLTYFVLQVLLQVHVGRGLPEPAPGGSSLASDLLEGRAAFEELGRRCPRTREWVAANMPNIAKGANVLSQSAIHEERLRLQHRDAELTGLPPAEREIRERVRRLWRAKHRIYELEKVVEAEEERIEGLRKRLREEYVQQKRRKLSPTVSPPSEPPDN